MVARRTQPPTFVSAPVLSNAPRIQSWYMLLLIFSCGGGSIKSNSSRFSTPRLFSNRTTLPRFVRWISGIWLTRSSRLNAVSVYSRWHTPLGEGGGGARGTWVGM